MLAQNFKTPEQLHLTPIQHEALCAVLKMLELGEITPENFDMSRVLTYCGSPCCILGWANAVRPNSFWNSSFPNRDRDFDEREKKRWTWSYGLMRLFTWGFDHQAHKATPAQAAMALRNYLTTGKPSWPQVLGCQTT